MEKPRRTFNPVLILGVWTTAMIILTPIVIYSSFFSSIGGEQRPLTLLVTMPIITIFGALAIAIFIPFGFPEWFRINKWFILVIIALSIPSIVFILPTHADDSFSYKETYDDVSGDAIKTRTEYYNLETKQIKSIAIWRNGKRDSVWTTFDKEGKIIRQKAFKNDVMLKP